MKKMLVVYYGWSNGNTERVAEMLADAAGADICRIETKDPYPEDYDETVALAKRQVEAGFEPELKPLGEDLASYDAVAVGSPLWWYTMAPAVRSFLAGQSWEGKTVIPFVTDAGWLGRLSAIWNLWQSQRRSWSRSRCASIQAAARAW